MSDKQIMGVVIGNKETIIPTGGTHVIVGGEPVETVSFDSDPQKQINDKISGKGAMMTGDLTMNDATIWLSGDSKVAGNKVAVGHVVAARYYAQNGYVNFFDAEGKDNVNEAIDIIATLINSKRFPAYSSEIYNRLKVYSPEENDNSTHAATTEWVNKAIQQAIFNSWNTEVEGV